MNHTKSFLHTYYFQYVLIIFLIFMSGCSYKKNFSPITRNINLTKYQHVAISLINNNIEIQNNVDVGILSGMGYGAYACIPAGGGEAGAIFTILCLPIGIIVGGVTGTYEAYQVEKINKESEGGINAQLNMPEIQKIIYKNALSYAQKHNIEVINIDNTDIINIKDKEYDYSALYSNGIDKVVEFQIVKFIIDETGIDDVPIFMKILIKSKLIDTINNKTIKVMNIELRSNVHKYSKLASDNFQLLHNEYQAMLSTAVSTTIDEFFLLYYPTYKDNVQNQNRTAPYYVLNPHEPKVTFALIDIREIFSKKYEHAMGTHVFTPIKEKQPTFRWESFPWVYDQINPKNFSNIVYDLKIYEYQGPIIYERNGLKSNEHKVEQNLHSDMRYLWTVRARFKLNSKTRVTEWGGLYNNKFPAWRFGCDESRWTSPGWQIFQKKHYYYPFEIIK